MRSCRHCAHENADHLAICSQCGRRLCPAPTRDCRRQPARAGGHRRVFADDAGDAAARRRRRAGHSRRRADAVRRPRRWPGLAGHRRPAASRSRVRWLGDSIGYIYVYLRGKLDAERAPAAAARGARRARRRCWPARSTSWRRPCCATGSAPGADGLAGGDRPGARPARGRGRRHGDLGVLQQAEAHAARRTQQSARRGGVGRGRPGQPRAEEILRAATADRRAAGTRLARVEDERARIEREAARSSGDRRRAAGPAGARRRRARGRAARAGRAGRAARRAAGGPAREGGDVARRRREPRRRSWIRSSPRAGRRRRRWRRASPGACAIAPTPSARSPS